MADFNDPLMDDIQNFGRPDLPSPSQDFDLAAFLVSDAYYEEDEPLSMEALELAPQDDVQSGGGQPLAVAASALQIEESNTSSPITGLSIEASNTTMSQVCGALLDDVEPEGCQPVSQPARNARAPVIDPAVWEFHRPEIQRLYFDENKTLKEVIFVLQNQYGFNAT